MCEDPPDSQQAAVADLTYSASYSSGIGSRYGTAAAAPLPYEVNGTCCEITSVNADADGRGGLEQRIRTTRGRSRCLPLAAPRPALCSPPCVTVEPCREQLEQRSGGSPPGEDGCLCSLGSDEPQGDLNAAQDAGEEQGQVDVQMFESSCCSRISDPTSNSSRR
eukprot:748802-Hanusia_phi.AAC.3